MRQQGRIARVVGFAVVLLWSLVPIYWSLKTSLETEAAANAQNYVPLHPTLGNYAALLTRYSITASPRGTIIARFQPEVQWYLRR